MLGGGDVVSRRERKGRKAKVQNLTTKPSPRSAFERQNNEAMPLFFEFKYEKRNVLPVLVCTVPIVAFKKLSSFQILILFG